jgi:hypothetical protein
VAKAIARAMHDDDPPVSDQRVPGEVVHGLPADLRKSLIANATALDPMRATAQVLADERAGG